MTMNSSFIATGDGYANKHGHKPADERTGNALIENLSSSLAASHPDRRRWLYVTDLRTSWQVQGSTAQARTSRSFYPQHLSQSDLTVVGQCSSQYEYDLLVQFVHHHHKTALGSQVMTGHERSAGAAGAPIEFRIIPYDGQSELRGVHYSRHAIRNVGGNTPKVHVKGYITSIKAGAARFKLPTFELTIKVADDMLQDPTEASRVSGVLYEQYLSALRGPGGWVTQAQIDEAAPTGGDENAARWHEWVRNPATFVDDVSDWTGNLFNEALDTILLRGDD